MNKQIFVTIADNEPKSLENLDNVSDFENIKFEYEIFGDLMLTGGLLHDLGIMKIHTLNHMNNQCTWQNIFKDMNVRLNDELSNENYKINAISDISNANFYDVIVANINLEDFSITITGYGKFKKSKTFK